MGYGIRGGIPTLAEKAKQMIMELDCFPCVSLWGLPNKECKKDILTSFKRPASKTLHFKMLSVL